MVLRAAVAIIRRRLRARFRSTRLVRDRSLKRFELRSLPENRIAELLPQVSKGLKEASSALLRSSLHELLHVLLKGGLHFPDRKNRVSRGLCWEIDEGPSRALQLEFYLVKEIWQPNVDIVGERYSQTSLMNHEPFANEFEQDST